MPDLPLHKLFSLLFMMTGPLRVVPAFAGLTATLDAPARARLARRAVAFAAAGVLLSVSIGVGVMKAWGASPAALSTAAGLLLCFSALGSVMGWGSAAPPAPAGDPDPRTAVSPLAFPTILPPFAVGVLILFGAYFPDAEDQLKIVGLAAAILVADLIAMRYAQRILDTIGTSTLQLLGAVFGVLQLSLALEMIFWGVKAAFVPA